MQTDQEILAAARDLLARQGHGPEPFVPLRNHPHHIGVVDTNYVRPLPSEFPKVVYRPTEEHPGYVTRVVASQA